MKDENKIDKLKIREILKLNTEIIEQLQEKVTELEEEKKTNWIVTNSDDMFEMAEVAKVLNYKGFGRNKIFELLRDLEILRYNNQPYQSKVDQGYFKQIEQNYVDGYGNQRINLKTVVTQKGIDYIRRRIDEFLDRKI